MNQVMGTCLYCGQSQTIQTSGELDEQEANVLATQRCKCDRALHAQEQSEVMDRVDGLFGPRCREMGFEYVCDVDQREALAQVAVHVLDELYDEAKIKLPNGDVATMKLTAGMLEISREMKRKRTA